MIRKKKGFTLIELVLSIAILGVMAGCLYPFLLTAIESWILVRDETDLLYESRQALNTMTREIRQAKKVLSHSNTAFSFINMKDENVTFTREGKQLYVSKGPVKNALLSDKISSGDSGFVFTSLDSNGKPATKPDDIRMVRIQISLTQGESTPILESLVKIRNL